jgi:tRNA A-37 threonylcarbamoyl transferase component Bud32
MEYGFRHNDLHCANILFDKKNENLVMIDYGKSIFSEYVYTENKAINNFLKKEMYKLNLNEENNYYEYNSDINSYKKLINFDFNEYDDFYYKKISKTGNDKKYYYVCFFTKFLLYI